MKITLLATLTLAALVTPPLAAQDEAVDHLQEAKDWALAQAGEDTFLDEEELDRALAEIQVMIDVDGDEPRADLRFVELGNRAWAGLEAAPEEPERREVLRRTLESYAGFLVERGRFAMALQILGSDLEQIGDAPAGVALRAVFTDARIVAMREQVEAALGQSPGPPAVTTSEAFDPVRAAVQRALENNDQDFVARLGTAALPALDAMIREAPDRIHLSGMDPLVSLALIDPPRALELIGDDTRGGPVWRSRVLEALRTTDLLDSSENFAVYPAAYETLARYMTRAETRDQAWKLTSKVRTHVLPAALWDILCNSVASEDASSRARGLALLYEARDDDRVVALAEELLASPYVDARRKAASVVVSHHGNREPLPALARDEDPSIRAIAASALQGSRTVPEQEALELLLVDGDEMVRRIALQSVADPKVARVAARTSRGYMVWAQPPSAEVMRALAADANPEIRSWILEQFDEIPDAAILPFLEVALAGTSAPQVIAHAEDVVPRLLYLRPEDTDPYFAVIRRIVEMAPELPRTDRAWHEVSTSWKEDPAELQAFVDLACETENPLLLQALLENSKDRGQRAPGGRLESHLAGLDPESWARIARAIDRSSLPKAEVARVVAEMPTGSPELLVSLTYETPSSTELQLLAAARLVQLGEARAEEVFLAGLRADFLLASLREKDRNSMIPGRSLVRNVLEIWRKVDGPRRNALIARFLSDSEVPDETAAAFAVSFSATAEGGPELARALLERWWPRAGTEESAGSVVEAVLWAMTYVPEIRDDEVLHDSLMTRALAQRALDVIERLRDPAHLSALAEYARRGDYQVRNQQALRIIASYQTEDAVQALVDAAASSRDDENANYCLEMLERIRQLHAARELWRQLASEKHSREGSVTELLALLEDPSEAVQIQAVRGLATFGAIEAIPALIRRMKDASPTLRAEVEAALEKLNRSEGE